MPIIRVGVKAPPGGSGQIVDFDGDLGFVSSIANVSGEAIQYSANGGTSWTTVSAGATASVALSVTSQGFRVRRSVAGGYPLAVDVTADADGQPAVFRRTVGGFSLATSDGDRVTGLQVSPSCVFCIPTLQAVGSGAGRDVSGNGHDMALGTGIVDNGSGLWSSTVRDLNSLAVIPGGVGTGRYLYIPTLNPVWKSSQWFIFSMMFRLTESLRNRNLVNCANDGATFGWYLKTDNTGKVYVVIKDASSNIGGNIASTPTLIVQNQAVVLTVAVDPVQRDIFLYANGVLVHQWLASWANVQPGESTLFLATDHLGKSAANGSSDAYGGLYGAFHYYRGEGALPQNHAAIARRLAHSPFLPLGYLDA